MTAESQDPMIAICDLPRDLPTSKINRSQICLMTMTKKNCEIAYNLMIASLGNRSSDPNCYKTTNLGKLGHILSS